MPRPLARISLIGAYQPIQPLRVIVRQPEFSHDLAEVTLVNDLAGLQKFTSGWPVKIDYGVPPLHVRTFWGYVNDVYGQNEPSSTTQMTRKSAVVRCVGASYWMKSQETNSWLNRTCSQVVADVTQRFRLDGSQIQHDSHVWPSLMQGSKSFWSFFIELANKIGYTAYCPGLQVHFHERNTNPTDLTGYVPVIDVSNRAQVWKFIPRSGATAPTGGTLAFRTHHSLDPTTLNVITLTDSGLPSGRTLGASAVQPVLQVIEGGHASHSMRESQKKLDATVANNKLTVIADLEMNGDVRITQGMLAFLRNADPGYNGLWYVMSATHTIDAGRAFSSLVLGRESLGPSQEYTFTEQSPLQPRARLLNDRWVVA